MISLLIKSLLIFLISLLAVHAAMPAFLRKAKSRGMVARDMYKPGKPFVPTMGGLVMIAAVFLGLVAALFFVPTVVPLFIFYFIVFSFGLYGLADDLLGFKKSNGKVLVLFFVALPIALITTDTNLSLIFFNMELGTFYALVFAPLYVMIVANLINMYEGYNGLGLGLSLIILIFAVVKLALRSDMGNVVYLMPLLGVMFGMLPYNSFPAMALLGNVGTFMLGAGVGVFLVLAGMEFFGVIILFPHIVNFLMWIIWCIRRLPHIKFARVNGDGTIRPPNWLSMKYLVTKLFRLTEPQAVLVCYAITTFFGIIGLILG